MSLHRRLIPSVFVGTLTLCALAPRAVAQDAAQLANYRVQWSEPSVIDSKGPGRGGFAAASEYYSARGGRNMWAQEYRVGFGFTDALSLWIGRQNYLLHGQHAGDKFTLQDDMYGGKWVIIRPKSPSATSLAVEFEVVIPGSANAVTPTSSEEFFATKNNSVAIDYGPGRGWETQFSYTSVNGAQAGYANDFALGVGKDLHFGALQLRLQGQLVGETSQDSNGDGVVNDIKPVFYAGLGYDVIKWFRIEADGTLFTSGMPYAASEFTGLSSFQIYNPGGAAANLRTEAVGVASIRVMFHGKF